MPVTFPSCDAVPTDSDILRVTVMNLGQVGWFRMFVALMLFVTTKSAYSPSAHTGVIL